jgi:iron complex transport system substrate-binding protein
MRNVLRNLLASAVAGAVVLSAAAAGKQAHKPGPPSAKPMHIMSMNICSDLLLLQMVPKTRIASVTFLAHDAVRKLFPGVDEGVAINSGTSEDIINERPDLILADDYSMPETRSLAAGALHARLIQIKPADNFDDIRAAIHQVGVAVGEPGAAETMIRRMDATLAQIPQSPLRRPMRVVAWSGGAFVPGKGTLTDAIITAAGAVNIAAQPGAQDGAFDVERLLQIRPDALLYGGEWSGKPSLRAEQGQHRLVREIFGGRRIEYDDVAHECGLPQSADSARDIHRALLSLSKTRPVL